MIQKPFTVKTECSVRDLLPVLELYDNLEISMSQVGQSALCMFLKPADALRLAEALISMARNELERKP